MEKLPLPLYRITGAIPTAPGRGLSNSLWLPSIRTSSYSNGKASL